MKKQKYDDIIEQVKKQKSPIFEDPLFPRSMSSVGPSKGYFSTRGEGTEPPWDENGLVGGHAYSITKVVQFESNGTVHQLVRVRNPWGDSTEWTGQWSDDSAEWKDLSDEEKTHLGLQKEDDGEFFISYNDFKKVVNTNYIYKLHYKFLLFSTLTGWISAMYQCIRLMKVTLDGTSKKFTDHGPMELRNMKILSMLLN